VADTSVRSAPQRRRGNSPLPTAGATPPPLAEPEVPSAWTPTTTSTRPTSACSSGATAARTSRLIRTARADSAASVSSAKLPGLGRKGWTPLVATRTPTSTNRTSASFSGAIGERVGGLIRTTRVEPSAPVSMTNDQALCGRTGRRGRAKRIVARCSGASWGSARRLTSDRLGWRRNGV